MKNIANKKIKHFLHESFASIKKHKIYNRIRNMSLAARIIIFFFCVLWFIIATLLVPPIPFGNMILLVGFVILFPLDKVRSTLRHYIYTLRINTLYTKRL